MSGTDIGKPGSDPDELPLGWGRWPTQEERAAHVCQLGSGKVVAGLWLSRSYRGSLMIGLFDYQGRFVLCSVSDFHIDTVVKHEDADARSRWFCPIDEWGRPVRLTSSPPTENPQQEGKPSGGPTT